MAAVDIDDPNLSEAERDLIISNLMKEEAKVTCDPFLKGKKSWSPSGIGVHLNKKSPPSCPSDQRWKGKKRKKKRNKKNKIKEKKKKLKFKSNLS